MSKQFVDKIKGDFTSEAFKDTMTFEKCQILVHKLIDETYPSPLFKDYEKSKIYRDIDFMIQKNHCDMNEEIIKQYIKINSTSIINSVRPKVINDLISFYKDLLFEERLGELQGISNFYANNILSNIEMIKLFYDKDFYNCTLKCAKIYVYKMLVRGLARKYMFKESKKIRF
jgi:hypothetical protein